MILLSGGFFLALFVHQGGVVELACLCFCSPIFFSTLRD